MERSLISVIDYSKKWNKDLRKKYSFLHPGIAIVHVYINAVDSPDFSSQFILND